MAYNTKLYKSTGSAWEEVRVASDWGLIANKPSTYTPTAHRHYYDVKTVNTDFTLTTTYKSDDLIICSKTSTQTITIPLDSSYNHSIGTRIDFIRSGASEVYFVAEAGATLSSEGTKYYINASGQAATLIKDAANHWLLIGALKE